LRIRIAIPRPELTGHFWTVNTATAFALIDRDRQIVRSTEGFRALGLDVTDPSQGSPGLENVLTGTAPSATMVLGDTSLEITAVTDAAGTPYALVSGSPQNRADPHPAAGSDDWVARLSGSLEESPALAWLKDAEGRHVYVNRAFTEALRVSEDQVLGRTDEELQPAETVDGPRRSITGDGVAEPDELEYTVPAFAERPAFAAVRFAVRDDDGNRHGVCGLAAPLERAQMVREEAARTLHAERGTELTPEAARAEVLYEWGLALADHRTDPSVDLADAESIPPPPFSPPDNPPMEIPVPAAAQPLDLMERWDECVQRLQDEARRWQDEVAQSRAVVEEAQEEAIQALSERDEMAQRVASLQDEAQRLQDEAQRLQDEAQRWQEEAAQSRSTIEQVQEGARQASSERDELTRSLATLQDEAQRSQDEAAESRTAVEQAQEEARQAASERDELMGRVASLRDEAERSQDEMEQTRAVVKQAQEEAKQAASERDELTRNLAAEHGRNEELVRTIEQFRSQIADLGRTIDHALPGQNGNPPSTAPPQFLSSAAG
jgi:PAS domain-containing protein